MDDQTPTYVSTLSIPKGGAAIQSIGKGMGAVGTSGAASFDLPLPISVGRGFAPTLGLSYSSGIGNSPFGIGWAISVNAITRRTSKGVPTYTDDDVIVGASGDVWMPERDDDAIGAIKFRTETTYNHQDVGSHKVVRYWPRVEGVFDLIEHWSTTTDEAGFWLVHSADGNLQVYGKTHASRRADPERPKHVGVWLLDEILNTRGEHIVYEYKADDVAPTPARPHDYRAQRYLCRVCYGNFKASELLYSWKAEGWKDQQWHFELLFDYGERTAVADEIPTYQETESWSVRSDPFSNFAYGFELGTQRLCRQVLMFHRFPGEPDMGPEPVLVRRLRLEYKLSKLSYNHLAAAHIQAYTKVEATDQPRMEKRPPMEFTYNEFEINPDAKQYQPFDAMPGLNDGQRYQLVDLHGEGLPGILYREDKSWHYREPLRANSPAHPDEVVYGDWALLSQQPVADSSKRLKQSISDLSGDGLGWIVSEPGFSGYFTRNPDQSWSNFVPFAALPLEFHHWQAQLADLMGDGLSDLAMIGSRSVRLYANRREKGFAPGADVPHEESDALPVLSSSPTELVAFSDVLGSGQQHLVRIRHNEVKCWPNLGRGRFGKGFVLSTLPFNCHEFDASRILLPDLDGSGAADLIYLESNHARIFMNRGGNGYGLEEDAKLPWPEGVLYDRFCQVTAADLQGLGCSSLILTAPHMSPRHWRFDFVSKKPYLLCATNNNMGAAGSVSYRGSAQEWLDEKQQALVAKRPRFPYLSFSMPVVNRQTQCDEVTGNILTQKFQYREAYYDNYEREVRGFGLLLTIDAETSAIGAEGFTAPTLTKTWFHTGRDPNMPRDAYYSGDISACPLGESLYSHPHSNDEGDEIIDELKIPSKVESREMARALSGLTLRVEVFAADDDPKIASPYSVQQNRYLVRELRPLSEHQPYAVMLPLLLESITYQYERNPEDPLCQHTVNLQWDRYGSLTRGVTISYARRKSAKDDPVCMLPTNEIPSETRWWCDAHTEEQQSYYLSETLAQYIHLDQDDNRQSWRLGLPYRQRSNALVLNKGEAPDGLSPESISYEAFINGLDEDPQNPLGPAAKRVLCNLIVHRYKDSKDLVNDRVLPDGIADFPALPHAIEIAELDEKAIKAYESLPVDSRPDDNKLRSIGYHLMPAFLPEADQSKLWSVKKGFTTYAGLDQFYNIKTFKETESHGATEVSYDTYSCLNTSVKLPDDCTSKVEVVDYRLLLPCRIVDANGTRQEALYGAFGQLFATSFQGTEFGNPLGFGLIADYVRPENDSPKNIIENPSGALLNVATALFEDSFSWMGQIAPSDLEDAEWQECVAKGYLLPEGYIRASGRAYLTSSSALTPAEIKLRMLIEGVERQPVYAVTLQADSYPDSEDSNNQIRIDLRCWDGFGRTLQSKQKVEPGVAYKVNEDGSLALDADGNPVIAQNTSRWLVSGRVEYNNKGSAIRIYRPYFADQYRYINDESFKHFGPNDRQFYDPLGRPTETWTANGGLRRQTYFCWYIKSEDENDTLKEVEAGKSIERKGGR
ncbi:Putative toxin subunit [Pseudomonas chlororaphis]|uniref:Toxin subunit n=1 Tax=Pseudomonas chlororaphis TaxID=587753 RepID=A0A3G7TTE6_9PSED|nr:SpvB/TcaC N-terminal domain-containing protein [Pseudomonas chlororaphis]AZE50387.1 Putative toxin subunit [Pseudomonas chlororaphis]